MGHWVDKKDSEKEILIEKYKAKKLAELMSKFEKNMLL